MLPLSDNCVLLLKQGLKGRFFLNNYKIVTVFVIASILTSNENETPKYTSKIIILNKLSQRISCDFMNTKDRHDIDLF